MHDTRRKTRRRLAAVFPLLLALMILLPLAVFAADGEESGLSDLSLYQRASEVTREFGTKLAPGSNSNMGMIEGQGGATLEAGNAGGMLGYADILSDDKGVVGWLMSSYTASSATITYDQLMNVVPSTGKNSRLTNPFYQYAAYGDALTKTGLITTVREGDFVDIGRLFASGLMMIAYLLANVAPFIFSMGLYVLDAFNPFKLFGTALTGISESDLGIIAPIAKYVSDLYETVQNLTVALILPMLLIITVLGILLWRAPVLKTLGRYWLRVFMLFAGLPLIGATYTGTISQLNEDVSTGASYANYLVLSSYVDFEGWVKNSRLAPVNGVGIQNPREADASSKEGMSLANRSLVLAINGGPANIKTARDLAAQYAASSEMNEIFKEGGGKAKGSSVSDKTKGEFRQTFDILFAHMFSSRYTGSQYDGEVAGQIQKMRIKDGNKHDEDIVKMFSLSASDNRTWQDKLAFGKDEKSWLKPINWDDSKGLFTQGTAGVGDDKDAFKFGSYDYNIYNGGSLVGTGVTFNTDSSYTPYQSDIDKRKSLKPIGSSPDGVVGGLSPLAMYNFLNTTFSDTGLTVYSPAKTSSDLSRDAYATVSFAGTGISSMTRWLENLVVMLGLAIISIAYGIMMVMSAIRTLPRILSGVFGTAAGSIAYMTKLLISVAVLLIQIFATVFMYLLSQDIVMTILLNFNELTSKATGYFSGSATAVEFIRSFMVIIVTTALTLFMIKNMKTLREMLEEVTSTSINRVMGALDTKTGGRGLDIGQTSGGRVGGDGKLTDAAKAADNGLFGNLADAHNLESQKGQMAEARGLGKRSLGEGIKARLGTAAKLSAAGMKDAAGETVGFEGSALDRERKLQEAQIKAIGDGDLTALGKQATKDYQESAGDDAEAAPTNSTGQTIDEDGNVLRNEDGTASDAYGNPISAAEPLADGFGGPLTTNDGVLLDKSGNPYLDEAGNAIRANKDGKLIDDQGNLAEIGDDGIVRPLAEGAAAVSAAKAAKTLDKNRFDADKFASMRAAQGASHYGINKDGQVVDKKGNPVKTPNGPATLDREGFLVDGKGERIAARDMKNMLDTRGFETVTDPETGQQVLKHKGDEAMRSKANITPDASGDPMALAKQANAAAVTAREATQRVDDLKAAGAPAYVVQQAERYAARAEQVAEATQAAFDTASLGTSSGVSNLTQDHVESATRGAEARTQAFEQERGALATLRQEGAPKQDIQRQEQRVNAARNEMMAAQGQAADVAVAHATGRSVNDVAASRTKFERAENAFGAANVALADAQAKGAPPEVLASKQAQVDKASNVLASAQAQYRNVQQAPRGSFGEIRQAEAKVENLGQALVAADKRVETLAAAGAPPRQVEKAQKEARALHRQRKAAINNVNALKKPAQASSNILPQAIAQPSVAAGFAALAQAGVKTYGDYQQHVGTLAATVATNQGQVKQAKERLAAYQSTNRSPAMIQKAQNAVKQAETSLNTSRSQLKTLQDNAHGLLKNQASFKPPIATRPLNEHGGAVLNKMIELHQAQRMVESMDQQVGKGTMTKKQRQAHQVLKQRTQTMQAELKQSGISAQTLANSQALGEGVRHMNQSWNAFVGGTMGSAEAAATSESPRRNRNQGGGRPEPQRQPNPQPERSSSNRSQNRQPERSNQNRSQNQNQSNANQNRPPERQNRRNTPPQPERESRGNGQPERQSRNSRPQRNTSPSQNRTNERTPELNVDQTPKQGRGNTNRKPRD